MIGKDNKTFMVIASFFGFMGGMGTVALIYRYGLKRVGFFVLAAILIYFISIIIPSIITAPEGYEDKDGFHLGKKK